jgi:hypothetical protein
VRYARAVIPRIGRERVSEIMAGYLVPIERALVFVNGVLSDVKDNGIDARDLDHFFDDFRLIAEIGPVFEYGLIGKLVENLEDPDIAGRFEYGRREELIALAKKCVEVGAALS